MQQDNFRQNQTFYMAYFSKNTKGIGSFFSGIDSKNEKFLNTKTSFEPNNSIFFYTGRQAIKYVIELIKLNNEKFTIWLPEYYCMHVTKWLKNNYSNIKTYKTNPSNPDFKINASEFASEHDVIIINNYWGISKCLVEKGNTNTTIIEDHSHGWLSPACINSDADYCIVSLRKSLPIPLGGMAWSPKGHRIKSDIYLKSSSSYEIIWDKTLKAMELKRQYEETGKLLYKNNGLALVGEAELDLHGNNEITYVNAHHIKIMSKFLSINFLEFKYRNIKLLSKEIVPCENFNLVTSNDYGAFGLILHFNDKFFLDKMRNYLITYDIYPSLLWPDNKSEYGYYLNIHLDYRYTAEDMLYVANTINNFTEC